jgi:hypothetical protein
VSVADEWSPESYGQDLILLTLSPSQTPRQFEIVLVGVDYSACLPAGIVLPLEFTISSESGAAVFQRKILRRFPPSQISFVPREGGAHLIRLAEAHHNRWWGSLQIDVLGERINQR